MKLSGKPLHNAYHALLTRTKKSQRAQSVPGPAIWTPNAQSSILLSPPRLGRVERNVHAFRDDILLYMIELSIHSATGRLRVALKVLSVAT